MSILKDIPELIEAGLISQETGDNIQEYYKKKGRLPSQRLFVVFGVLGAILVGLGIILIIAHNWDELSKWTKTIFAFLPLLIGQLLCGFTLVKRKESMAWRESASAFLFFSVGASISLVSQIYNIPGDLGSFLFSWMLLCLPLLYVMQSSISSLLYLAGICYYAAETGYWSYPEAESYSYWGLLLLGLPHYYFLYKRKPGSNFMLFHNWVIPLSLLITLGIIAKDAEQLMFIAYFSLFGVFYLIGDSAFFNWQGLWSNGYKIIGSLSSVILLLVLSFDGFWEELRDTDFLLKELIRAPEFFTSMLISLLAAALLYLNYKGKWRKGIKPLAVTFAVFILIFMIGLSSSLAVLLVNIYVLIISVLTIINGAKEDHLGILNYGLLILSALIMCRFFDTDLSFVMRGVLFVIVGLGFFAANYLMLKKRKGNE